jgi:hypothetical protein
MLGFRFSHFNKEDETPFDKLFNLFKQLLTYTSGDFNESISWLTELDKEYKLTALEYGIGDFIQELKDRGYIKEEDPGNGEMMITAKTELAINLRKVNRGIMLRDLRDKAMNSAAMQGLFNLVIR